MISVSEMRENLRKLLEEHDFGNELELIFGEILDFMSLENWRGACHESCGVQYVLLNEIGISCEWRLGEVSFEKHQLNGKNVCFDHSWIVIENEIYDLAVFRTSIPKFDSAPTIKNVNLETLSVPEVIYDTDSGWGDDHTTQFIKSLPLSTYFDNSPIDPNVGTWALVERIGKQLGIEIAIAELRQKYNGVFWK